FAARLAERVDSADGEQVLPGEEGRRRLRQREHLVDCASRRVSVAQLGANQVLVDWDAGRRECLPITAQPLLRSRDREEVAEKPNAPVSVLQEMGNGLRRAAEVVG